MAGRTQKRAPQARHGQWALQLLRVIVPGVQTSRGNSCFAFPTDDHSHRSKIVLEPLNVDSVTNNPPRINSIAIFVFRRISVLVAPCRMTPSERENRGSEPTVCMPLGRWSRQKTSIRTGAPSRKDRFHEEFCTLHASPMPWIVAFDLTI